ncbi:MAG: Stp1/IreP family PP2C-type Ser/Thr phosphatase, partial [Ktedonobacteraceae bacterium]|nr:Stp1/IreP family PP2C-type Ser/Thr phosphatase [Ktedonobacteraceae bacterium]
MSKQLRLDVAQLTDVGRKRSHNEDNMAYVTPQDTQVVTKKGSLFIVADGMGGHAAGEIASELAVETISNAYYQDDNENVATALLYAIKRANTLIHQRSAENMLRSGMGTTCVAMVICGNVAYIANVGDSRAYIVHGGQIKQVSQDHSWVAEQVRAGLLTEDQARSHAQRNVITRCLGTQTEVEVDIFAEVVEEHDTIVLCTDGLSGLVNDVELCTIAEQYAPQESVYHLVERANEHGGPDNITAIVVRILEVGEEQPSIYYPIRVGSRQSIEETTTLAAFPSVSFETSPQPEERGVTSAPLRLSSGPLDFVDAITTPQPILARPKH